MVKVSSVAVLASCHPVATLAFGSAFARNIKLSSLRYDRQRLAKTTPIQSTSHDVDEQPYLDGLADASAHIQKILAAEDPLGELPLQVSNFLFSSSDPTNNRNNNAEESPDNAKQQACHDDILQSSLHLLEKRVRNGRGALTEEDVAKFEMDMDQIIGELSEYMNNPVGVEDGGKQSEGRGEICQFECLYIYRFIYLDM